MNTEIHFSSKTDLWETPQFFFDRLEQEFHFDLDACALPENAKCLRYISPEQDGLKSEWHGNTIWCNPPYGRMIGAWVKKAYQTSLKGKTVVMLLPARTDTKWFHEYIYHNSEIRFVKGRLKFGEAKNAAPFPSMVVIFKGKKVDIND